MLAIALVADVVLCAVFALMVRVGGPPIVRADTQRLRTVIEGECENEGLMRARVYEMFLERQTHALAVNDESLGAPVISDWQPSRGGWYAAELSEDEQIETEIRVGLGHLAWCEDRRAELAAALAADDARAERSAEARMESR